MFFIDLLFALAVALLLTLIFAAILGTRGPWASVWVFLLVVFLAAWAGGLWITPFGPPLFDTYWLPFLLVGLIFALLLAAVTPVAPPRTRREAIAQAREEEAAVAALTVFFWVLIIALAGAVVLAYFI